MPKKIEQKLKRGAAKHHMKPGTARYNKYVYGTVSRIQARRKGTRK